MPAVATVETVARIAAALPEVTEGERFGNRTWLVRRLLADGWSVTGAVQPRPGPNLAARAGGEAVRWVPLELTDPASVRRACEGAFDAVVHLAAVASGSDAASDPGLAWEVNAAGTARLVDALAGAKRAAR